MRSWRCDQGRLAYFQLAKVSNLAQALNAFAMGRLFLREVTRIHFASYWRVILTARLFRLTAKYGEITFAYLHFLCWPLKLETL
jgi:hypothetical protein